MFRYVREFQMYTFFEEDCCHEHVTSVSKAEPGVPAYWSGFLAGPQGPHYRHLKVSYSNAMFVVLMCTTCPTEFADCLLVLGPDVLVTGDGHE